MLGVVELSDTLTIVGLATALVIVLVAGVPASLIHRLRLERDTEREARQELEKEMQACRIELAEAHAKTDLTAAMEQWRQMHEATLHHLEKLEAATAGGFAEVTRAQRQTAQILERLVDKTNRSR